MGCLVKSLLGIGSFIMLCFLLLLGLEFAADRITPRLAVNEWSSKTGFGMTMEDVSFRLRQGSASIRNLRITNPEGWPEESFATLSKIKIDLKPSSLGSQKIIFDEILVELDSVSSITTREGQNNLRILRERLQDLKERAKEERKDDRDREFLIQKLTLRIGSIHSADYSQLEGENRTVPLNLEIQLNDVTDLKQVVPHLLGAVQADGMHQLGVMLGSTIATIDPALLLGADSPDLDNLSVRDGFQGLLKSAQQLLESQKK
jgi:hypothetical protein